MAGSTSPDAESRPAPTGYLRSSDRGHVRDWAAQARFLAAVGGPGPWRQLWDLTRLRLSRSRASADDYYRHGIWKGGVGRDNVRTFLLKADRVAYCRALHLPGCEVDEAAAIDKLETERRLVAAGLPVVRTRAAFGRVETAPAGLVRLETPAALDAFLSDPSSYPLFAKPATESFGRGSAGLAGVEGDAIRLTNGVLAPRADLVAEIVATGLTYLFQPLQRVAPDIARHAGRASPTLRLVTLRLPEGISAWYATMRLPALTAMSDGGSVNMRLCSEIDIETGEALRWCPLGHPHAPAPRHWADPDTPLSELRIPAIGEAVRVAVAGHEVFPRLGLIGWDLFVTEDGPVLNEANSTPMALLQTARGVGIRTGQPEATYQRAVAAARAARAG